MSPDPYVAPFLGAGGDWLCTLDEWLVPLVAWMGGKRRLAPAILRVLGVAPGSRPPALLGDACWWGWVWPLLLGPRGPEVCAWLRSWGDEDPRELWFRLRDEGPAEDLAERAAGLLWLQARAASGVPVWWRDDRIVSMDGKGNGPYLAWQMTGQAKLCGPGFNSGQKARDERRRLVQQSRPGDEYEASQSGHNLVHDEAGQRQATAPACAKGYIGGLRAGARGDRPAESYGAGQRTDRLLAFNGTGHAVEAGHKQRYPATGRAGGIVRTATIAERIEAIRAAACGLSVEVHHVGADELTEEWAPRLGASARVYLDPPYQGATGYPAECPREDVLAIAETWARHGARVALSEAVDLSRDLGPGWSALRLRGGRKAEWLTTWGCDHGAALGPLFAARREAGALEAAP